MIDYAGVLASLQWFVLCYFAALNGGYLMLNVLSYFSLRRQLDAQVFGALPQAYSQFKPPISVLVPACNEASAIAQSVRALLSLDYPEFEVIVINDGSTDGTLAALQREFELAPFAEAYWARLATRPVRGVWRSARQPNLRVVDKERGGRGDALNAGINAARYPLFCTASAGAFLRRDSLQLIVQPFIEDARTVAAAGAVHLANGCEVTGGLVTGVDLPRTLLLRLQVVEYLRAFLFSRLGWAPLNAVMAMSGAFGLFRRASVLEAGGYRTGAVGEDTELVMRLHRFHRNRNVPYRIHFVAHPVCWVQAPETLRALGAQHLRWQRGLAQSLVRNAGLLVNRRGGWAGWAAFPFMALFEGLGPVFEVFGYAFMMAGFLAGVVSLKIFLAFLLVAFVMGVLLSVSALLMEELSLHLYPRARQWAPLLLVAVLENLGYRQLTLLWRLGGLLPWLAGAKARRPAPASCDLVPRCDAEV